MQTVSAHMLKPTTSSASNVRTGRSSPLSSVLNGDFRQNVGSSLLSESDNQKIFTQLGSNCYTLATGIAQVLKGDPLRRQWTIIDTGALCYVRDYNCKAVTFRLIDPGRNNRLATEKWRVLMPSEIELTKKHTNLITFQTDDETVFGFNFSAEKEAANFFQRVQKLQQIRRERLKQRKNRTQNSNGAMLSPNTHKKAEDAIHDESGREMRDPYKSPVFYPNEASKNIFSPLTAMVDNALTSIKQSVPTLPARKKTKKQKKEKIQKLDIGLPTDFVHKVHMGDSPFCISDSEIDETIIEIYKYLNFDISKADKKEIEMIRREVSTYGPAKIRASMRKSRKRDPHPAGKQEEPAPNAISPAVGGIKDARDSIRFYPRDIGRSTPATIKHFDGIKRRESSKREPTDNVHLRNQLKGPALRPSTRSFELEKPKKDDSTSSPLKRISTNIESNSDATDDWSIQANEMRKQCDSSARDRRGSSPLPKYPRPKEIVHDEKKTLPTTLNHTISIKDTGKTILYKNSSKNRPRLPGKSNNDKTQGSSGAADKPTSLELNGKTTSISSIPPPPAPPPPSLSSTPAPKTTDRQNLLEAIRNADKSNLRKVSPTSPTKSITSPGGDSGNLMDAIGKMIEERRQRIAQSSDEEDEDEEESGDDAEWTD